MDTEDFTTSSYHGVLRIRQKTAFTHLLHYHPVDLQQLNGQHCPNPTKQMLLVMTELILATCWWGNTSAISGY